MINKMSYICKGTRVLTISGYKPVEHITILDKLMESDGIFRHPKNLTISNEKQIIVHIDTSFQAHCITCTQDQNLLTKPKGSNYAVWKKAYEVSINDYIAMIKNKFSIIPSFTFVEENSSICTYIDKNEEWFLLGYYLTNGWIEAPDHNVCFIIQDTNVLKELRKTLPLKLADSECFLYRLFDRPQKKYKTYVCSNNIWYKILKSFQKKQNSRLIMEIPEWVQNAPIEFVQHFIRGFEHNKLTGNMYTSSYATALGLQRLYAKLGIVVSLYKNNINNTFIAFADETLDYKIDEDYIWFSVSCIEEEQVKDKELHRIDTNKGYIIENIIVA